MDEKSHTDGDVSPAGLLARLRFDAGNSERRVTWRDRLADAAGHPPGTGGDWEGLEQFLDEGTGGEVVFELEVDAAHGCLLWPARRLDGGLVRLGARPLAGREGLDERDRMLLERMCDLRLLAVEDGRITEPSRSALTALAEAGRLVWCDRPLPFDGAAALEFSASVAAEGGGGWRVWGRFGDHDLWAVAVVLPCGLMIVDGVLRCFQELALYPLVKLLQDGGALEVPREELADFVCAIERRFAWRGLRMPAGVQLERVELAGTPLAYLHAKGRLQVEDANRLAGRALSGYVTFRYGSQEYPATAGTDPEVQGPLSCCQVEGPKGVEIRLSYRNLSTEKARFGELLAHEGVSTGGLKPALRWDYERLLDNVYDLLRSGWEVWAEKVRLTVLEDISVSVEESTDWFDVGVKDGRGDRISTWQLINFLKRRALFLQLGDGRVGLLPESWFHSLRQLLGIGRVDGDKWLFSPVHAPGLSELRDSLGADKFVADARFDELLRKLEGVSGVKPGVTPEGFRATLRPYQALGLAWLSLLDEIAMGGCLADDMGLGKTIQVLAFFAQEKARGRLLKASLVIVPKSVVEQWRQEAARLAPMLRVAVVTRKELYSLPDLARTHDLIFVSYGLVRRNSAYLANTPFHYVVLDEAQAIKNPGSKAAAAVKMLDSSRRLALTGTPIENRLEELLSIFAFLNPGLLVDGVERPAALLQSLRPLVLRRLKADVLDDLPEKTETVLKLPMTPAQRERYESVRTYYRDQLAHLDQAGDFEPLKLVFLEGLLRLRQIACDAGLVAKPGDPELPSNKLDYLLAQLATLVGSGHKVVVFSQFVTFLHRIRSALEERGLLYSYLDGQTRQRDRVVKSFQDEPSVSIFLVSVKAGGVGLNLTAADYCFIMDPWWNPAVEQQAIDRLHRMGQKRSVFVYKLLSAASVEDKMLELHQRKRAAADLLGVTEQSFLEGLSIEDFRGLF